MKRIRRKLYNTFAVVILAVGGIAANAAPGGLFVSVNGTGGNGGGFIYRYAPNGMQSTFASGLSRPRGLAFDSVGNLFVATNFTNNPLNNSTCTILKITPDGTQNVFAILGGHYGQGVAIDRSDNVFVMTFNGNLVGRARAKIYKFTPQGTQVLFGLLDLNQSFGLAFNSGGNLFAADTVAKTIFEFAADGTRSMFVGPSAFPRTDADGPVGLAFDQFGNLFVSTEIFPFTNDTILKFTPSGVESTFAIGLHFPRGLVFDSMGNLFVAENPGDSTGDILKITSDGARTVFASGIGIPQGNGGPEYLAIVP